MNVGKWVSLLLHTLAFVRKITSTSCNTQDLDQLTRSVALDVDSSALNLRSRYVCIYLYCTYCYIAIAFTVPVTRNDLTSNYLRGLLEITIIGRMSTLERFIIYKYSFILDRFPKRTIEDHRSIRYINALEVFE